MYFPQVRGCRSLQRRRKGSGDRVGEPTLEFQAGQGIPWSVNCLCPKGPDTALLSNLRLKNHIMGFGTSFLSSEVFESSGLAWGQNNVDAWGSML